MATQYANTVGGNLKVEGRGDFSEASFDESDLKSTTAIPRSKLAQDTFAPYAIPLTDLRVHDNFTALLPQTAASDDLAIIETTFGTNAARLQTSDAKTTSVTQRCRFNFPLPPEYDDGQSILIRVRGGMNTTISDGTATVDVECYAHDGDGAVGSDLCATNALTINVISKANKDFTITPTGLSPGDMLDVRVTIAITDTATGTAVIGEISDIQVMLDIKG